MIRSLAVLAILLALPATAQTVIDAERPEVRLKVTLAPELSAVPSLYSFLREEAEVTAATYGEIAAEDEAAARKSGQRFSPYSMEIRDDLRFLSDRYASLLRVIDVYTGGAHGNVVLEAITADRATGRLLRLDDFLAGPKGSQALRAISNHLVTEITAKLHGGSAGADWTSAIRAATRPDIAVLQNFTLAASTEAGKIGGFVFHFAPYEVAPYASGPVAVIVPQSLISTGLKPELRGLFGGNPG